MLSVDVQLTLGSLTLEVDQNFERSGITALFGPSGSGKTSLLRVLAGLERAQGRIAFGEDVWLDSSANVDVPVHRRGVGYMFQDGRLFGHLSVSGNLRYADRRADRTRDSLSFAEVVSALDLEELLPRRIDGLSGGEKQRVALGRTLLSRPSLLLLDEPLSALDSDRKAEILPYLLKLPGQFGLPTLYVSHSVEEVALLADRTLVLAAGRVRAEGETAQILERLDLQALTGRFEAGAVIHADVRGHDAHFHLTELVFDGQTIAMPMVPQLTAGDQVRLRIRARDVSIATQRPKHLSIRNILDGKILELVEEAESAYAELLVQVGEQRIRARLTRSAVADLALEVGQSVYVLVKSVTFDGHAP